MTVALIFWGAVVVLAVYSLFRNLAVYRVRIAFIDDNDLYPAAFQKLPSYDGMLFGPKHQLRWTKTQWVKYIREA